jgi:hypothetical protein
MLFYMLAGAALALLGTIGFELVDKSELIAYIGGFVFVGCSVHLAIPFATGSQQTTFFHGAIAILLIIAVVVFLAGGLLATLPLELTATWSDHAHWSLLGVLVLSGGFCLFIGSPLSILLYILWRRENRTSSGLPRGSPGK